MDKKNKGHLKGSLLRRMSDNADNLHRCNFVLLNASKYEIRERCDTPKKLCILVHFC